MTEARSLLPQLALTSTLLVAGLVPVGGVPGRWIHLMRDDGRNQADLDRMEHGYYEQLLATTGPRVDANLAPPPPPPFKDGPLAVHVSDYRECVLRPSFSLVYRHGLWTNNELGLRDQPYSVTKPENTFRIVMLGDSIGVGWGVNDGEGFEPRLEVLLDQRSQALGGPRVEILNLSVPGYAPGQRVEHLERLGWSLQPDLILYEATEADVAWDERRLRGLVPLGIGFDVPMIRSVLDQAGLQPGASSELVSARLKPLRQRILESVYEYLGAEARRRNVPVVWVLIPRVGRSIDAQERVRLMSMAQRAGFDSAIDLADLFQGLTPAEIAVSPDDYHPNALGHERLARAMEAVFLEARAPAAQQWPWKSGPAPSGSLGE